MVLQNLKLKGLLIFSRTALVGLALGIIASGCASLSKEECARANWDGIGYGDGSHGKPASRFNAHQKACAEHGFDADFALYKQGHQRGLKEVFCKPRNGYQLGLSGAGYNNVCPADLERLFLPAYHYGQDINKTQRTHNSLKQQASNLRKRLAAVDKRIAKLKHDIKNDDLEVHANSAQDLRSKRKDTTALYDRIRSTRNKAQKSNVLKGHLRHELTAQNRRFERCVTSSIGTSGLVDSHGQAIRRIANLSVDAGHLKSKVNWVGSNPERVRPRRQEAVIVKRQLSGLLSEINQRKKAVYRHPFDLKTRRHLEHSFEQAEYAGVLQHHQDILAYLYDSYALNVLIDIHFDAEMENLNRQIEFARHYTPSKEEQALIKNRRSELNDAQRQHRNYQHRISGLEQKIGKMQRKIEDLKAANRF